MWCLRGRLRNLLYLPTYMPIKFSKIDIHKSSLQKLLKKEKWVSSHKIHNINNKESKQVGEIIEYWHKRFEKEKIVEPRESIEHIITYVLGIDKIKTAVNISEKNLTRDELQKLEQLCECRLSRMPVQYIVGEWDFRYIKLKLEPPIFIPRVETEMLVEVLLKRSAKLTSNAFNILEIGCGSGAISLSLLYENKDASVVAIDTNSHACELTMTNARNIQMEKNVEIENRLLLLNARLKQNGTIETKEKYSSNQSVDFSKHKFEIIVSNPPYIPTGSLFSLQPEIKFYEDMVALHGGEDGLKLITPMLKYAYEALNERGYLILEVDPSHPEKISALIKQNYENKFRLTNVYRDFCNKDRIVEILKIG